MLLLAQTSTIKHAISEYSQKDPEFVKGLGDLSIPHEKLIHIANSLGGEYRLSKLVKGTNVYIPPKPEPAPKSKEYVEMMKRLEVEYHEREYKRMVDIVPLPDGSDDITPGMMIKQTREQISAIANVVISVASVAWAMWYWSGSSGYSDSTRTLLSVFGGLGILVAETVVYLGYKNKIQDAKTVERKKKEKTNVISTYEIRSVNSGSETAEQTHGTGPKQRSEGLRQRSAKHEKRRIKTE
jgi:hypothetical protein